MPIVLISSAPHSMGEELAHSLKQKTGWPLLDREMIAELAHDRDIKLGRLETAIIKSPQMHEKLAREKKLYLAFASGKICEYAEHGNLIYHGRAGHLLLPGVSHRLRVGIMTPKDQRIKKVMQDLNLSVEKATAYIEQLDEDIDKWVRFAHREASIKDPRQYDTFLNLQILSLSSASTLLCDMANLPEFKPSPVSLQAIHDIHLTARAVLKLAFDERTRDADLGVRATNSMVTVTYRPRQEVNAQAITAVLDDLEDVKECMCTLAESTILCIHENFDPASDYFAQILELAGRWGAAIELVRYVPSEKGSTESESPPTVKILPHAESAKKTVYTGGVEDDRPRVSADDGGLSQALEELISAGRSAGGLTVYGEKDDLLEAIEGGSNLSLVAIGDLFLEKGKEAQQRNTRDLALSIRERLKVPVITCEEMASHFLFRKKQAGQLIFFTALVACVYAIVFSFQAPILNFLGGEMHAAWKWLTPVIVFLFVPFVAYCYSTVTGLLLKLIGID
jgi:hypothetical protein